MRSFAILGLIAMIGCASSGTSIERPATTETIRVTGSGAPGDIAIGMSATALANVVTVDYATADVWRVLPTVYQSFAIPLTMMDSAGRVVGNAGFNLRRRLGSIPLTRLVDCGSTQGTPSADTYDVHLSVLTQVKAGEGGRSAIATTVDAMGKPVAFSGEYIRCSSTGSLETRIADAVRQRLAK